LPGSWVLFVISVGSKGQQFIADRMKHPYAYHVIIVCIQLIPFLNDTRGPFFVIDVLHSPQKSAVLKRTSHFAKIVTRAGMVQHPWLLAIKGRP